MKRFVIPLILLAVLVPNMMAQHWTPIRNAVWGVGGCLPVGSYAFTPSVVVPVVPTGKATTYTIPTLQTPRPDGYGYCSSACVCGCNSGKPCECGKAASPAPLPMPKGGDRIPVGDGPPKKEELPLPKLPSWITEGVARDKFSPDAGERCIVNGAEVGCRRMFAALGADEDGVPDDSAKLRVVILGSKESRAKALKEIEGATGFAEFRDRVIVQAYAADNWAVKDVGYRQYGDPTVYIVSSVGKVLHRSDYAGADKAMEALRKASSGYDPSKDPDLTKPKPSTPNEPEKPKPDDDGGSSDKWPKRGLLGLLGFLAMLFLRGKFGAKKQ